MRGGFFVHRELDMRQMSLYATVVAYNRVLMPKTNSTLPTRREREIMNAVFALGNRASADEIRARLTNPPTDSAVRVMLARLEKKGCLKHQQDGPRYLYSATISPAVAKRTALKQYLQTFFGGSLRQMMTALVADASWTEDDLDALKAEIDRVRIERQKQ
jgi:predicted transcriptional regulator